VVCYLFCWSSSYVLCTQCCQFFWIVHSWLQVPSVSLKFIKQIDSISRKPVLSSHTKNANWFWRRHDFRKS
jgi:hypothetical protein